MKKKIVSSLLVAAMVVTAFAGCGSEDGGTSTQRAEKAGKSSGKVYMLNFKPETDEAWQTLAETYTDQTGVEVNVLLWSSFFVTLLAKKYHHSVILLSALYEA